MDKEKTISIHSTTRVETMVHGFSMLQRLISIHSTTRVETEDRRNVNRECWISIHSTTRVETGLEEGTTEEDVLFQSTPPRGWRRDMRDIGLINYTISIHSTTRVETTLRVATPSDGDISIHSTTRVETQSQQSERRTAKFQSTPPRGWRRYHFSFARR